MIPVSKPSALDQAIAALVRGTHGDPFAVLGPHAEESGATIVRAFQPAATSIEVRIVATGALVAMEKIDPAGVFQVRLKPDPAGEAPGEATTPDYRLRITYAGGQVLELDDPYRYGRVLTDFDLHLFSEGTHYRAFEKLGAHRITQGSTTGVHFAVWAPNADRVSVIGDFNGWDGRVTPMRFLTTGVWEIFRPRLPDGESLQVRDPHAHRRDPEKAPIRLARAGGAAAARRRIVPTSRIHVWRDGDWIAARPSCGARLDRPVSTYEVHLGSWARASGGRQPLPDSTRRTLRTGSCRT